jgi:hypothetical protein
MVAHPVKAQNGVVVMKRSLRIAGASVVTIGLVAGGVGFASASGNTTSSAGRTLHFEVEFSPFFFLDLGEPGPSMGDQIVSHDVLLDETGQQVGHDGVSCVLTDPAGAEAECTATFAVPGGQITTQFLNTPPPEKHLAVTGGTGAYRNARGEAVLVERGDNTGTVTFYLIGSRAGE